MLFVPVTKRSENPEREYIMPIASSAGDQTIKLEVRMLVFILCLRPLPIP